MTAKKKIIIITLLYLIAVVPLGVVIHGNFELKSVQNACFAFVVLNFVAGIVLAWKSKDFWLVSTALLFTVFADRILSYNVMSLIDMGIILFTFTQVAYFFKSYYLEESKAKRIAFGIVLPTVFCVLFFITLALMGKPNGLTVIAITYFSFLVTACLFAFARFGKDPLFAIGLLLFIACDFFLGAQFVGIGAGTIIHEIDCWWFYYPSQILIILSIVYTRLMEKTEQ
ncbi:MAG: hypothetical protein J6C23_08380 [Clostridia bacterium]|nr:hypothetical protein [Clostridia bacterium]